MRILILMFAAIFMSSGIAQADSRSSGATGAILGAGVGALIGHNKGNAAKGAVIGAVGGYVLGSAAGASHASERRHNNNQRNVIVVHERDNDYKHNQKGQARIMKRSKNRCHEAQELYNKAFNVSSVAKQVYLLEKAAWFCPQDARVHNDLGVSYYSLGGKLNNKRARDQFQIALYLRPNYKAAKQNLRKMNY